MASICAECKKQKGASCCEVWVGDSPTMPLSLPEVQKIAKSTGMRPLEFMVIEEIDPMDVSEQVIISPVFKSLLVRESRIRLKTVPVEGRNDIEKCVFLSDQGCTLKKSDRPYGCRLFPFTYNHTLAKSETGGLVRYPTGSTCLAAERSPTNDDALCALLGSHKGEMITLGRAREDDAKTHKRLMDKKE